MSDNTPDVPLTTALYERLSHDDENQGESNSIVNQKKLLTDYALQHGMSNTMHFADDGCRQPFETVVKDAIPGHAKT